jgi:hypothetical protein
MPPPPVKATPSEVAFLMYVGYCITTWADVEEKLFKIFWRATNCPKKQAAIIYYRTPTLDARLSLTDELVKHALPKPEKKSGGHPHRDVEKSNEHRSQFPPVINGTPPHCTSSIQKPKLSKRRRAPQRLYVGGNLCQRGGKATGPVRYGKTAIAWGSAIAPHPYSWPCIKSGDFRSDDAVKIRLMISFAFSVA